MDPLSEYIALAGLDFRNHTDRLESIRSKKTRTISNALGDYLGRWNNVLPKDPKRDENLQLLRDGKALAVVTGQQLGLFGGPLFTLYKIVSMLKLAEALSKESSERIVPVFWLQSEDHDYLETNSLPIIDATGKLQSVSLAPFANERISLGDMKLPGEIANAVERFMSLVSGDTTSIAHALSESYVAGRSVPEAFAQLLSRILPDSGIIFFEPRGAARLGIGNEVFERAFTRREEISTRLAARTNEAIQRGLTSQVFVRDRSPLFFFHDSDGQRYRIEEGEDGRFTLLQSGASVSEKELLRLLKDAPERFSTSALLRPILQDTLFPSVAYVGGEAEVRYFAQSASIYPVFELPRPMVVPRSGFQIIDSKTRRLLEELRLSRNDFHKTKEELQRMVVERLAPEELSSSALQRVVVENLTPIRKRFEEAVHRTDPTLMQPLEKSFHRAEEGFQMLIDRYQKALMRNSETAMERLERVYSFLAPDGVAQERVHGVAPFFARYGENLINTVLSAVNPLQPREHQIEL